MAFHKWVILLVNIYIKIFILDFINCRIKDICFDFYSGYPQKTAKR